MVSILELRCRGPSMAQVEAVVAVFRVVVPERGLDMPKHWDGL